MEQLRKLRAPKRKLTKKEREKIKRPLTKEEARELRRGLRETGKAMAARQKERDDEEMRRLPEFLNKLKEPFTLGGLLANVPTRRRVSRRRVLMFQVLCSLFQELNLPPVGSRFCGHVKGNLCGDCPLHFFFDEGNRSRACFFLHFIDEFIMYLKQKMNRLREAFFFKHRIHSVHCYFDDVCRRALNRCICRHALRRRADIGDRGAEPLHIAPPPKERLGVSFHRGYSLCFIQKTRHFGKLCEVVIVENLRFLARAAQAFL